jgi:hypothetical protein
MGDWNSVVFGTYKKEEVKIFSTGTPETFF